MLNDTQIQSHSLLDHFTVHKFNERLFDHLYLQHCYCSSFTGGGPQGWSIFYLNDLGKKNIPI